MKSAGLATGAELDWLLNESQELRAIFVQAALTARLNDQASRDKSANDTDKDRRRRQP